MEALWHSISLYTERDPLVLAIYALQPAKVVTGDVSVSALSGRSARREIPRGRGVRQRDDDLFFLISGYPFRLPLTHTLLAPPNSRVHPCTCVVSAEHTLPSLLPTPQSAPCWQAPPAPLQLAELYIGEQSSVIWPKGHFTELSKSAVLALGLHNQPTRRVCN